MSSAYVQTCRQLGHVAAFRSLCEWWTQASQEARYGLYGSALKGDKEAPPLDVLRLAVTVAEIEHGEFEQAEVR